MLLRAVSNNLFGAGRSSYLFTDFQSGDTEIKKLSFFLVCWIGSKYSFETMSMASLCRGFRQALRSRGSILYCGFHYCQNNPKPRYEFLSVLESYVLGKNRSNSIIHDQLRLANAHPPPPPKENLSTQDVAAILRFVHFDAVKRKLEEIPEACISYQQLLQLCLDCTKNSSEDEGRDIIKKLEQSGDILRIGQIVYLHPQQIARALESVLPLMVDDCCPQDLRKLEMEKAEIEKKCHSMARKELLCGLGIFAAQTAVLCRLTFWELSWDVMEPICFYLTSVYFILGYAFFLKTSKDPSFENIHAARVDINRKKLMKYKNFDLERYRELQRICNSSIHK